MCGFLLSHVQVHCSIPMDLIKIIIEKEKSTQPKLTGKADIKENLPKYFVIEAKGQPAIYMCETFASDDISEIFQNSNKFALYIRSILVFFFFFFFFFEKKRKQTLFEGCSKIVYSFPFCLLYWQVDKAMFFFWSNLNLMY